MLYSIKINLNKSMTNNKTEQEKKSTLTSEPVKKAPEIKPEIAEKRPPKIERVLEKPPIEEKKEEEIVEVPKEKAREAPVIAPPAAAKPAKSPTLVEIEQVLQENLEPVYSKMTPEIQEKFKIKGEVTASKIEVLIKQVKVNTKKILDLIIKWLKMIPGVNKYFLEQEAKIKIDKILKIKSREEKK